MTLLRVMTYNIRLGGRGGYPLHETISKVAPDVLLVNESPKTPFLSRSRCERLAAKWAMRFVAGGRDGGSNMIAVAPGVHVDCVREEVLPQPAFRPRRGVVSAHLRVGQSAFSVLSCHLGLHRGGRRREVERILEIAADIPSPVVLGGDLNEPPQGRAWTRLRAGGFADHGSADWLTFPSKAPVSRIDALLVRGDVRVLHHGDPGVPVEKLMTASDHRPVLALLELPDERLPDSTDERQSFVL